MNVSIDELVPDDHLFCLIEKYIDFSILLLELRSNYSDVILWAESKGSAQASLLPIKGSEECK
jgi:hypothetical protein